MMGNVKVSIIVPMYNVEKYIEKCIASTYEQSLEENDFELVIVDDESPDNSLEIAREIEKKHGNIKIISQKNKGLGGARNTGIQQASGDYLLFLDSDDTLLKNSLPPILSLAEERELDILEFGAQGVNGNEDIVFKVSNSSKGNIFNGISYYNNTVYLGSACNKLYRRAFLLEKELLFREKVYAEDFEFNTRALYYAEKVEAIDAIVASWLQNEQSITRDRNLAKKDKYIADIISNLTHLTAFREQYRDKEDAATKAFFSERFTMLNIDIFYQLFKNSYPLKRIREVRKELKEKGLLHTTHPVRDKKKNLFRKVLMNNSFVFGIVQFSKRLIRS